MTETAALSSQPLSRGVSIGSWILRVLLALAFAAAGTAKLLGVPMMVETFNYVGIGQWFRYVTGALEIAGAIALFLPRLTGVAALGLGLIMIGAIAAHLLVLPTPIFPAVILCVFAFTLVAIHRDQIKAFTAR